MHKNFIYYTGIILDAFAILLCSKLCWHIQIVGYARLGVTNVIANSQKGVYICMCVLRTCVYPCTHNFCSALLSSLIQLYSVYLCIFDLFAVKLCINNNCRL